jgi:isopentenyl-diphosphate delta-isomerase
MNKDVEAGLRWDGRRVSGLDDILILHNAMPELDMSHIDVSCEFLGKHLKAPVLISSMTGGHPSTFEINKNLAIAAQNLGIGIGVGSQRAALEDPSLVSTYSVVREMAPDAFVYGNLGAAQLGKYGVDGVLKAVEMIDADAMAIHLNFLQEAIQPEGDTDARGVLKRIEEICSCGIPIIVKETGCGIKREEAIRIRDAGASAIDVAGFGGTSWAGVEWFRSENDTGKVFWEWGIPTAVSIVECGVGIPLIASGGIRSGIDCAKCIALGADVCALALPLLKRGFESAESAENYLREIIDQLRISMFLTGSMNIKELKKVDILITGPTREMLEERGHITGGFVKRRAER